MTSKPPFCLASLRARLSLPLTEPPTPFVVECHGLDRETLGDARFEQEFWIRKHWLIAQCIECTNVEALRDRGRLIGRRFKFECNTEAAAFKISFPTRL